MHGSRTLCASAVAILLCATTTAFSATLTWTGAGDGASFTDVANWSGSPTGGVIDKAALVDDYVINDPAASISEAGNHSLSGGSITVNSGEIQRPAFQGINSVLGTAGNVDVSGGVVRQWFLAANAGAGTTLNATISGDGEIELFGAGAAINNGDGDVTVDLVGSSARFTFLQKTATEVVAQFSADIFVSGSPAVFGADPLAVEPGDNAVVVENGGAGADNVSVVSLVPEPASAAALFAALLAGLMGARSRF